MHNKHSSVHWLSTIVNNINTSNNNNNEIIQHLHENSDKT